MISNLCYLCHNLHRLTNVHGVNRIPADPALKCAWPNFSHNRHLLPKRRNSLNSAVSFASHKWLRSMQLFHISVTNGRSEFDKLSWSGAACRLGCRLQHNTQHLGECRLMRANERRRIAQEVASSCALLPRSSLSTLATSASRQSTPFIQPASRP